MKKLNLKKIITMGLITTSILAVVPVGASAEWRQSNNGWWYTKANGGYDTGWEKIGDSWYYFDSTGYMKEGWVKGGSNWYYLKGDGTMATGTVLTDGQISNFTSGGIWTGYITNNQSNSNTTQASNNNNSSTNNSNSNNNNNNSQSSTVQAPSQTANTDFTFENAVKMLNRIETPSFYSSCFHSFNYEFTKGGYNGYPVEDKIYIYNDGTKDIRYRFIGVIDKYTGEYLGILLTFENDFAIVYDGYDRANYTGIMDANHTLNERMDISEETFDRKGTWKAHKDELLQGQAESEAYWNSLTPQQKVEKRRQDEENANAMLRH